MTEPFLLDLDSNPHPVMLRRALAHRRQARLEARTFDDGANAFWHGYLAAMVDATGCAQSELLAWLDAHEDDE